MLVHSFTGMTGCGTQLLNPTDGGNPHLDGGLDATIDSGDSGGSADGNDAGSADSGLFDASVDGSISIGPVSPGEPYVSVNSQIQFNAVVSGTEDKGVDWSSTGGSISSDGNFTAPGIALDVTITGTARQDLSKTSSTTAHVVNLPNIGSFSAAKSLVTVGEETTLTGVFSDGDGVVDQGVGAIASGEAKSTGMLFTTTSFTLVVTSKSSDQATSQTFVEVVPAPDATVTIPPYVTANKAGYQASVPMQALSTFAWTPTNAAITAGENGRISTFTPGSSGQVTMLATVINQAGTIKSGAGQSTIVDAPLILAFTANPTTITNGQSSTLTATFVGSTGTVNPGEIKIDTSGGTLTVTPTSTTSYNLKVANLAGDETYPTRVTVTVIEADAGTADSGFDSGADSGVVDGGVDGGWDAGVDGGLDTGVDGGFDAGVDGGWDAGVDGGKSGLIIPGHGIEIYVNDSDIKATAFNVMTDTYGLISGKLGIPAKPYTDNEWYLRWADRSIDALFVNTAGKDTIDNDDLLNEFILTSDFNGYTTVGHGIGTSRTDWKAEMGVPDYTNEYQGSTADFYFLEGLAIVYDTDDAANQITVYRKQKDTPHYDIDWENLKVKDIAASLSSGSKFSAVWNDFGPEDMLSVVTQASLEIHSLTYIALGLTFTGMIPYMGAEYQVSMIAIVPPYYGVIKGSGLRVGALHAEVKAFMESQNKCCGNVDCTTKGACVEYVTPITWNSKTNNFFYYRIQPLSIFGTKYNTTAGFIYNADNALVTVILGYPVAQ